MSRFAVLAAGLLLVIVFIGVFAYMSQPQSENNVASARVNKSVVDEDSSTDPLNTATSQPIDSVADSANPTTAPQYVADAESVSGAPKPSRSQIVQPPALQNVLAHWTLLGLSSNSALFRDENIPQEFTLKVGGEEKNVRYPGWSFAITLEKTDPKKFTAYLRSNKHEDLFSIKLPDAK